MDKDGNSMESLGDTVFAPAPAEGVVGKSWEVQADRLRMLGQEEALNGRPFGDPSVTPKNEEAVVGLFVLVTSGSNPDGDGDSEEHPDDDLHDGRS